MPRVKGSKNPNAGFKNHPENINRKGRPKVGLTFAERVRCVIEEEHLDKSKLLVDELIDEAIKRAKRGNFQFWDALMARAYGKVPDKVETTTEAKPDLSKLTDDELAQWQRLAEKAKPG